MPGKPLRAAKPAKQTWLEDWGLHEPVVSGKWSGNASVQGPSAPAFQPVPPAHRGTTSELATLQQECRAGMGQSVHLLLPWKDPEL